MEVMEETISPPGVQNAERAESSLGASPVEG